MDNRKNTQIIIDFEPISRRVNVISIDKTLYDILTDIDIKIRSECRGRGTCGKCRIRIGEGQKFLNPPTKSEQNFIDEEEFESGIRLACQTEIKKDLAIESQHKKIPNIKIYLPDSLLIENFQILSSGIGKGVDLNPAVKKVFLKIPKPSLQNPLADLERIFKEFSDKGTDFNLPLKIRYEILKKIPFILRKEISEITLTIWNDKEIIDLEPDDHIKENFGIAFDIGTTTIVGYLINLNSKKIYAVDSKLNPQTLYGEDVISRISYIKEKKEGLEILQSLVLEKMNKIISKTCEEVNLDPNHIYEATIAGNSVMHHIFLGLNPIQIGISPYVPVIQKGMDFNSKTIKLNISKNGNIYTLPLIAGFVGADTMGVILSSKIYEEKELTLAIDIGTNGEIIIGNTNNIIAGSCAAGSALEGAHIKHGMRAAAGAIDSVRIDPDNFDVSYTTIHDKNPIGICGSGLIDIVAEMLRANILTRSGIFNKKLTDHNRFVKNNNEIEFIITKKDETPLNRAITLSLSDIRQIQMAKAAFYSGTKIMMSHLSDQIKKDSLRVEKILLAGAFGNYINKINAKFIGMIPDIKLEKIFQIGNAAGIGAQYCLLNKDLRKKANNLLKKVRYIEIANNKNFQREYAEAMYFPHINLNLFPSLKLYQNIPKR
ncbi:MAG: DUF4445 domain-containing protein [Candidatus Lokiarchaeota archaeon]|nr:DUF4445 domain-containing protein [Candidatus Lokiarchaeota archaeon]